MIFSINLKILGAKKIKTLTIIDKFRRKKYYAENRNNSGVISPELEQLTGSELVDYVNQHQTLWKVFVKMMIYSNSPKFQAKLSSTFNTLTMEERKRRMGAKSIEVPAEYRVCSSRKIENGSLGRAVAIVASSQLKQYGE